MLLVFAGVAIFAYIGSLIVEAITHGVVTGVIAERRRRKTIHQLRNHYIICGYGRETSRQSGRSIRDLDVRSQTGGLIIALRKRDGTFDTTPNPDVVIDDGDVMICVGTPAELLLLEEMFAPQQSVAR